MIRRTVRVDWHELTNHKMLILGVAAEEELSEEDQQLKSELDMMVERLTVSI